MALDLFLLALGTALQVDAADDTARLNTALLTAREAREREQHLIELQQTLSKQNAYFAAMGISPSSGAQQAGQEQIRAASRRQLKALQTEYGMRRRQVWHQTRGSQLGSLINFGFGAYSLHQNRTKPQQNRSQTQTPKYGLMYLSQTQSQLPQVGGWYRGHGE